MTGKERIIKILNHEKPDKTPWVPYIGIHGGYLIGVDSQKYLTDSDVMIKGLIKANEMYKPDGLPIFFDLQLEAEILGCKLKWFPNSSPSVVEHPFSENFDIPVFDREPFIKKAGRLGVVKKTINQINPLIGNETALYGLLCGPFTLAGHLRGEEFLIDVVLEQDKIQVLLEYAKEAAKEMIDFYIEEGIDIIGIVDPLISQISPALFEQLCEPVYKDLILYIKSKKRYSGIFVCGNATKQIEGLCRVKPHFLSVDENVDFCYAKKITKTYEVVLSGNIPVSTVLLHGTLDEIKSYKAELISLYDKDIIFSTGCDVPYDTPSENLIALSSH